MGEMEELIRREMPEASSKHNLTLDKLDDIEEKCGEEYNRMLRGN